MFSAPFFGLDPIQDVLIQRTAGQKAHISKEIMDSTSENIVKLSLPRLPPLLKGLAKRFLKTGDDVAMIAVEQLVDSMNLDAWVERNLRLRCRSCRPGPQPNQRQEVEDRLLLGEQNYMLHKR